MNNIKKLKKFMILLIATGMMMSLSFLNCYADRIADLEYIKYGINNYIQMVPMQDELINQGVNEEQEEQAQWEALVEQENEVQQDDSISQETAADSEDLGQDVLNV